jgi:CBS domain-containing protein
MSPTLTNKPDYRAADPLRPADWLDIEVRAAMTPGVISISENATLTEAHRALVSHQVHAVLVVGSSTGKPLGWITARGLLRWATSDETVANAGAAISQEAVTIHASATLREAVTALEQPGIGQLLVVTQPSSPEGVLSPLDVLAVGAL